MQWILVAGYLSLVLALMPRLRFFQLDGIQPRYVQFAFLLKVLAGIALGLIYSRYYTDRSTADTFKFFDDSRIIFQSLKSNPSDFFRMLSGYHSNGQDLEATYYVRMTAWNNKELFLNDNRSIIRINVLFQFLSLGNYYVHVVLWNLFSFTGLIFLYKAFREMISGKDLLLFSGIFLFPSLLFWGSGLLKDGFLLFSVGLLLYFFLRIATKFSVPNLIGFVAGITGLIFNKFYILLLLLPGLIAFLTVKKIKLQPFWIYFIWYSFFTLIAYSAKYISPQFDFLSILEMKRRDFASIAITGKAIHMIHLSDAPLTPINFLLQTPGAFARVLFRPFIWESDSFPILLAALENIFICVGIVLAFIQPSNKTSGNSIFWLSVFFIFSLFILVGTITPILGAIVRYRIIAIPFMWMLWLQLTNLEKLQIRKFKSGN